MATTVIRNAAWIVAWDAARGGHAYMNDADLAFTDDRIVQVGGTWDGPADVEIDGRDRMVMPGLVNIHSHPSSEPMNKGLLEELGSPALYMSSLYEFMPLFRNDPAGVEAAAKVAYCELMMSGVTTLADLSVAHPNWLELLAQSGLRGCIAPMFRSAAWSTANGHVVRYEWNEAAGMEAMENAFGLIERARQHPSGRLMGMVSPSQIDTCAPALLQAAVAHARARNLPFQLHAAQSVVEFHEITRRHGKTPIQWLDELGILGPNTIIGHGIFLDHHDWVHWPTRTDLGRLAATGTSVAHCPTVFCRRGITLQDFGAYKAAGINLGIGTDTFPHNMLEELRHVGYFARVTAGNVDATKTTDVFDAATIGGARALLRDDIGRLEVGLKADLALVDIRHPMMRPMREPLRSLIYTAAERAVRDVYCDGRQIVADGRPLGFDYPAACAELEEAQRRSLERAPALDWARRPVDQMTPFVFPRMG
ncbi:ethylammeline chlorohydrolase [Allostella vacuolata]|nr:ethylammeline chlorohydrolase [Stella vacuolata]